MNAFLLDSGLKDFTWHVLWAEDYENTTDELVARMVDVDGYVIFVHGVTASHAIWEELPGLVVRQNRRLVAFAVDHNGFGESPFVTHMPTLEQCSPVAAMHALENWFDLLGLRRADGERKPKTINFVGHSMGGAAMFFLRESRWRYAEQTRLALAPALLLHDELHKAFFDTVGLGVGLVARLNFLETIENTISHPMMDTLTEGATQAVQREHIRIYKSTPKAVTARAMAAMGTLHLHPEPHRWDLMQVILGHKDLLVGVVPMMDLLNELNFNVDQVRVVMGTHYLFSAGEKMKRVHEQNRALVLNDIFALHNEALKLQLGAAS